MSQTERREREIINICMNQDWESVLSRVRGSIYKLKQSGDYPEEEQDKLLMERLIDIKYFVDILKKGDQK